jgi:hypothetical protein
MNPDEGKTYPGAMNPDPPTKKPVPDIQSPPRCVAFDGKNIQDEFGGRRGYTVD